VAKSLSKERNNKMKKRIMVILLVTVTVLMLSGCVSKTNQTDELAHKRTITDMVGRTVEIPTRVEKIVPLGNTPRMIAYLKLAEKAVGIGSMQSDSISPVTAYAYVNKDLWKDLPVVGTDAGGATDYYPEQIIAASPDVIFCSYNAELANAIQTKTGTPTIAVSIGTLFGDDYEQSLRILADVCGVQDRAEEVISYINDCLNDFLARTSDIPDEKKPSVLGAAATFKGSHGIEGVYSRYPIFNAIDAYDVTSGISDTIGGLLIDIEQILSWNPRYIFLDSGGVGLVKQDYIANPTFYKQLWAINNDNVYQYPSSTSYFPNVEISLANCYYVSSLIYPEQFKDIKFEEKATEIFMFFLGTDDYLNVLSKSGHGYSKVNFGG